MHTYRHKNNLPSVRSSNCFLKVILLKKDCFLTIETFFSDIIHNLCSIVVGHFDIQCFRAPRKRDVETNIQKNLWFLLKKCYFEPMLYFLFVLFQRRIKPNFETSKTIAETLLFMN